MPGKAPVKALAINAERVSLPPTAPRQIKVARPHTARPTSIAETKEQYIKILFAGRILCRIPTTAP